jgi:protein phosphatase
VREIGFDEPRELHRALNALRYFRLVARMQEEEWALERLRGERERPRGRLHLLVGPAGCGKSCWARDNLAETEIVSSDQMRRELTGDPADQSQNYLVFQRCMDRVREWLCQGREVTFDATNCWEALRSMPVQAARWSAAEIVSYFFDVPLADALERNCGRERMVPERVIRRHYRLLQAPALYEADRHMVVDPAGKVARYWPVEDL